MLANDIKDSFVNTFFDKEKNAYITEVYDKWKRNKPHVFQVSYDKETAVASHNKLLRDIEKTSLRKVLKNR